MLATASERLPRGGALLMGLMGATGTLSINFVCPPWAASSIPRRLKLPAAKKPSRRCPGDQLDRVLAHGVRKPRSAPWRILPAILLIVFGAIWLYDRPKGGFKASQDVTPAILGQTRY